MTDSEIQASQGPFFGIKYQKLHPDAREPARGSIHAAGCDLYAVEDTILTANRQVAVRTGIAFAIPLDANCYGRIAPRSGLAFRYGVEVLAGVIDPDYRGEVQVILRISEGQFEIKKGDRIAQIIFEQYRIPVWYLRDNLDETKRGEGGFGSTGK